MAIFVNLPICLIILIGGVFCIKNNKSESKEKIDKLGTLMLICIIVSLLYGLMNIDFLILKFYTRYISLSILIDIYCTYTYFHIY